MNIGTTIRAIRQGRKQAEKKKTGPKTDYTQQGCADRAGMRRSVWGDLERDRFSPTVDVMQRVATGLGMSLAEVFSKVKE